MADPGFPIGRRGPVRRGVDLRHGRFLVKMCAKTKELGPVGGVHLARPLDLPMYSNVDQMEFFDINEYIHDDRYLIVF